MWLLPYELKFIYKMRPIENRESEYLYLMLAAQWRHRSSPSFSFYFYMNEHRFLVLFFPLLSRVMQRLMAPQIAGRIEGSIKVSREKIKQKFRRVTKISACSIGEPCHQSYLSQTGQTYLRAKGENLHQKQCQQHNGKILKKWPNNQDSSYGLSPVWMNSCCANEEGL